MTAEAGTCRILSLQEIEERIRKEKLKGNFCGLFFIIERISKCIAADGKEMFDAVRSVLISEVCRMLQGYAGVYGAVGGQTGGWVVLFYFKNTPDEEELIALYKRAQKGWNDILQRINRQFPLKEAITGMLGWGEIAINENIPFQIAVSEAAFVALTNKYLNKVMSGFVAEISHELRNPITCVKGCVELLSEEAAEDKPLSSKWMAIIAEESERLQRMVGNLYELSVLEMANISLHKENLDFVNYIRGLAKLWQGKVLKNKLTMSFSSQAAEIRVEIDKDRFTQAVLNLFDNAVKYAYPHSQIDVSLEVCEDSRAALRIKNIGAVIPEKDLPYIFDRYFRIENESYKGLGLGLALTSVIIKLHGGCIEVSSTEEGTVFSVFLKCAD